MLGPCAGGDSFICLLSTRPAPSQLVDANRSSSLFLLYFALLCVAPSRCCVCPHKYATNAGWFCRQPCAVLVQRGECKLNPSGQIKNRCISFPCACGSMKRSPCDAYLSNCEGRRPCMFVRYACAEVLLENHAAVDEPAGLTVVESMSRFHAFFLSFDVVPSCKRRLYQPTAACSSGAMA